MFCFVYQTATDWTNRYCPYVFDIFSTVIEFILQCNNVPCVQGSNSSSSAGSETKHRTLNSLNSEICNAGNISLKSKLKTFLLN